MLEFGAKIVAACQYLLLSNFMVVVPHSSSSSLYSQMLSCTIVPTPPPQSENIGTLPPLACLRLPTCDVDRVADGDPPQPLHSCWQRPHCPPLAPTVHFGGVKECIIIINPSNHNVDLNKEKYEHYKCLIIFTFSCPLLYPAHPCCFRPTVMSGRSTTQPCLLYLAQFRCFDIRFSESINVKVEGLCYLDPLVRVCRPPVIRTESSPSGMAQASLQIFIDI